MARAVIAVGRLPQAHPDEDICALAVQLLATGEQPAKLRPVQQNKKWV